ncbi:MAG: DUF5119 domain-containing protein [Muribaculaceae bacterium]|nr:DUF5119 domain-containing protein [Muribaculaceae bacterium]
MNALGQTIRFVGVALSVIVTATSCEHKNIECPGAAQGVHILFEWDKAAGADVAGMTLYFYPQDTHGRLWRFDIAGRDGGNIELPVGHYSMIACNNDLPGITLEDTDLPETIRATARRQAQEGLYSSTGMLYGVTVSSLEVTPCGVRYITEAGAVKECSRGLVRCSPDSLATDYTIILRNLSGAERIRSASAVLKGVYASMLLQDTLPYGSPESLAINMTADRKAATLTGHASAFAPPEASVSDYMLSLRIVKTDGKTISIPVEIKPENMNLITRHNVIITADGVIIPGDGTSSDDIGGIDAAVDGWNVIEIDVAPTV